MPLLEIIIVTRGSVFKGENGELINVWLDISSQ
jgi:hypothetical protein